MFAFLAIVLTVALIRFGANRPEAWLGLALVWAAGLAIWSVHRVRAGRPIEIRFVALAGVVAFLAVGVDAKLALAPAAGIVAWTAARTYPGSVVRFFRFLVLVGVLEALLGLFQYFVAPGWILGYVSETYATSGTLINRNHFAGLLAMLVPVAIGMAYRSWSRYRDPGRTYLYLLAGGVMGLALVFSLSRMGIFSFLATLGVLAILIGGSRTGHRGSVFALVPLGLVLAGAVWIGVDVIVERLETLVGPDGVVREARLQVFADTIAMIGEHPLGIGVGGYADTFRRYQTTHNALLFDHAHNDYLETAAEWGIPIAALFWAGVFLVFGLAVRASVRTRDPEKQGILLASIGAMFSILVHSLVDFNLQIPSNAMLFASFVGIALAASSSGVRLVTGASSANRAGSRRLELAGAALALVIPAAAVSQIWGPFLGAWITRDGVADPALYERALEHDPGNAAYQFALAQIYHFSTPYLDPERARALYLSAAAGNPDRASHWLGLSKFYEEQGDAPGALDTMARALQADPHDAETRWTAANLYVRMGESGAADSALRETAELDPTYVEQVLDLAWRLDPDPDRILATYVPDTRDANLTALGYFVAQDSEAGARGAWSRLDGLATEPAERLGYVHFLVNHGRPGQAYAIFLDAPPGESPPAFFNGSFETEPMNGGFDWRYSTGRAQIRRDTTQSRDGRASLLVQFSGEENLAYADLEHWLALASGRSYTLTFWMRTEGISTDQGIYVEVGGRRSSPVIGTTFWKEFEIPFVASSDLVTVRVRRDPSQKFDNLLSGKVWFDGFELREAE